MASVERLASASPELEDAPSKRKRPDEEGAAPASKRKRKRVTWADEGREIDTKNGVNLTLARMEPAQIADLLAKQTRRFQAELSALEVEEMRIPVGCIYDASSWAEPHLTEKLPAFLRHLYAHRPTSTALDHAPDARGCPHTLVVTGAGLRAADLVRVLRVFQTKKSQVTKLFAKHIKLKDAVSLVRKTRMGIGVGTPGRLMELLDAGALGTDHLARVVIDFSKVSGKTRAILDQKETQEPLMKLLARPEIKGALTEGRADVAFY